MRLIGHRGARALGPENTIAAIDAGLAAGADGVEVDVRMSVDGALVLAHDADLMRTARLPARVAETTASALREAGICTLQEALERVPPDRLLVIEVKGTPWEAGHDPAEPVARALAAVIRALPVPRSLTVSSFNPGAIAVVRSNAPGVRTAVLTAPAFDIDSNLAAAIAGGHEECHVPAELLGAGFVRRAHEAGRSVVAWTEDAPERLRLFAGWGVEAAICDDPRAARAALEPPSQG